MYALVVLSPSLIQEKLTSTEIVYLTKPLLPSTPKILFKNKICVTEIVKVCFLNHRLL